MLIPISAPKPSSPPSLNRVEAFHITAEASTLCKNSRAVRGFSVTIASVCLDPYWAMCSIASSAEPTTRTAKMRSRYSASQSASVAGLMSGTRARVLGQPRSSTPFSRSASAALGRNEGAIRSWTSRVSIALQTPGRCTFALTQILNALSGSASAST